MELSSSDDSSETDEEESSRLKEAVLGNFSLQIASESTNLAPVTSDVAKLLIPSQRNQHKCDDHWDKLELETTPEFRNFVSKHLSDFIESNIVTEFVDSASPSSEKCHGIKLFRDSAAFVGVEDELKPHKQRLCTNKLKRKNHGCSSSSDSEDDSQRLAEAAVSYEFISQNASPLQMQGITSVAPKYSNCPGEKSYSSQSIDEKKDVLSKKKSKAKKEQRGGDEARLSIHKVEDHHKWKDAVNHNILHIKRKSEICSSKQESNGLQFEERGTKKISKKRKKEKKS